MPPTLEVHVHCGAVAVDDGALLSAAKRALPLCLAETGNSGAAVLGELETIEVSLISDAEIARVHGEFMDDPEPTDVITFPHGEILISVETAAREGGRHGHSASRETLLYLIHGLLHLNGHDDLGDAPRAAMHAVQERILDRVSPLPGAENRE